MRRKRGHKGNLLPLLLVFLVGLTIFLYPTLNSYFTGKRMGSSVESFFGTAPTDTALDDLLPAESIPETEPPMPYPEVLELLEQYNQDIYADGQAKLNSLAATEQAGVLFCVSGQQGDMFGVISIPGIELEMPLYLGATEAHMAEGAAQLGQTSIPIGGENTNTVIAGHRGYNGAPYFRYVPELQIGDSVNITNLWGTLHYRVVETKIIQPNDIDAIKIQPGRDLITLLTCHPYASGGRQRFLVICERMEEENGR